MADTKVTTLDQHFPDLTTGELNGSGLFDTLMVAIKQHLADEYSSQRLRGSDYSKVYIGSMQAALQNAVQYLLGVGTLDAQLQKLANETKLVEQQILLAQLEQEKSKAQTALIEAQTATEVALLSGKIRQIEATADLAEIQAQTEAALLSGRTLEISAKVNLTNAQKDKAVAEIELVKKKTISEAKQLDVLTAQVALLVQQAAAYDKEIAVKKDKIQADAWSAKAVADGSGAGGPPSWT